MTCRTQLMEERRRRGAGRQMHRKDHADRMGCDSDSCLNELK